MKIFGSVFLAALACGVAVTARGGEKTEQLTDKMFVMKAAGINHEEIVLGSLAEKRAESSGVKEYAEMLVKNHKTAQEKLATVIKSRNIAIVTGLEQKTKEEFEHLSKCQGAQFDREFLQCMIKGHKKAIQLFEQEASSGKEEEVRSYAKEMLPELRKHLNRAEELAKAGTK
jgi:putative membrane protein